MANLRGRVARTNHGGIKWNRQKPRLVRITTWVLSMFDGFQVNDAFGCR